MKALLARTTKGVLQYVPGAIPQDTLKGDEYLSRHVRHARICEIVSPNASAGAPAYLSSAGYWESELTVYVYQLNEEGPEEGDTSDGGGGEGQGDAGIVSQYTHWGLPSQNFEGLWESLLYEDEDGEGETFGTGNGGASKRPRVAAMENPNSVSSTVARGSVEGELSGSRLKSALLQYASSAMIFADAGVDGGLISCNHVILLHGPPGTGKTR